jgi:hypothetical protein
MALGGVGGRRRIIAKSENFHEKTSITSIQVHGNLKFGLRLTILCICGFPPVFRQQDAHVNGQAVLSSDFHV